MNLSEAKNIVLSDLQNNFGDDVQLIDDQTIKKPYGWVFFYNNKKFIETRDLTYALMSNTPFIFTHDGRKFSLNMSCTTAEAIEEIERNNSLGA